MMSKVKEFLKSKQEWVLGTMGLVILAILMVIFIWGISFLGLNVGSAITSGSGENAGMNFDLKGAKQLNLKGLAQ